MPVIESDGRTPAEREAPSSKSTTEEIMKLTHSIPLIALTLGLGSPLIALADTVNLHADLKAASEVPAKTSDGHGQLTGTYDTSTKDLQWHVVYSDLTGPATMAHFHG